MRTLFLACGNTLRCDDGVAPEVLQHMAESPDREMRAVHQLTPECAELISHYGRVVFLDADAETTSAHPVIERVGPPTACLALTHASAAAEIVALARGLYDFSGEAFLCRIPARDFSPCENLTAVGLRMVHETTRKLERFS